MKKLITTVLILIMLASLCGCEIQEHTYVISKDRCNWLFGSTPERMEENKDNSPWVGDNYVSMNVDEEGNLVLVLNDKHIAHWKRELKDGIETKYNADKRDGEGYGFEYDETYTTLTYYTDREIYGGVVISLGILIPKFGMMQMLNGTDPNEWYVDITVKDVETGITIKTGHMPDDGSFGITDEDWDKALGPEEQEQNS